MAIIKSAKKAIRSSAKKRQFNLRRKKTLADVVKNYKKLVGEKKLAEAKKLVPELYQALDKAAKRGIINKGAAARRKARFTRQLAAK